jgi:hypothetical protein
MINAVMKLGIEGMHLNIIKAIYYELIANIILSWEKLKLFSLKSEPRQGCPLSPVFFNLVLEFLATAIRQEEEIIGIQIGNEEIKLFLFADDMILNLKELKNSTKKLLHHKRLQQSSRTQNQFTKISNLSIYQQ